jgi:hypothetical protein
MTRKIQLLKSSIQCLGSARSVASDKAVGMSSVPKAIYSTLSNSPINAGVKLLLRKTLAFITPLPADGSGA